MPAKEKRTFYSRIVCLNKCDFPLLLFSLLISFCFVFITLLFRFVLLLIFINWHKFNGPVKGTARHTEQNNAFNMRIFRNIIHSYKPE